MGQPDACQQGDHGIVLRRKPKKRYISILHAGGDSEVQEAISKRCAELFGSVAVEKAAIRLLGAYSDFIIIRCNLSEIHAVLVSLALVNPPMITLAMSGSVRRLRKRLEPIGKDWEPAPRT